MGRNVVGIFPHTPKLTYFPAVSGEVTTYHRMPFFLRICATGGALLYLSIDACVVLRV